MTGEEVRVLAISGSLREGSWNTKLLRAAAELAPATMTVDLYQDLGQIPPYNDDVKTEGYPEIVQDLRARVAAADALMIATPEYNRSFTGILTNAIDWASRPPEPPLAGKVAFVTGASPGALGTALANYHLRQVLSVTGVHVLPGIEVLVGGAHEKFDDTGRLIDDATRDILAKTLNRLGEFARQLNTPVN